MLNKKYKDIMNNKYLKDKYLLNNLFGNANVVFIEKRLLNKMDYISKDILNKNNINDNKLKITFIVEDDNPYIINIKNNNILKIDSKYKCESRYINLEDISYFNFKEYLMKDIENEIEFKNFNQLNKIKQINLKNYIIQRKLNGEKYQLYYKKENKNWNLVNIINKKRKVKYMVKTDVN